MEKRQMAVTPESGGAAAGPIVLEAMHSFMFGGKVVTSPDGETFHGDHGYAQHFVPLGQRALSFVLWHGQGQSGKTWESTPDGREGFWQLLLRRSWPVCIIDQPRRGRAGRALPGSDPDVWGGQPVHGLESSAWVRFRLGEWAPPSPPTFFPGVRFPRDPQSIEQFFRQQTPNTGPEPFPDLGHREFMATAVAELVERVGPSVLMTHSHSGQYGWVTAMRAPDSIKAIIALEPGEFVFPADDLPQDVPTDNALLADFMAPQMVDPDDFDALIRIPILMIMGDNISTTPSDDFGVELRRIVRLRAQQMTEALNRRGGDATYIELPQVGLQGNTHFMMSDLNNIEVLDLICDFLQRRGLDGFAPSSRPV